MHPTFILFKKSLLHFFRSKGAVVVTFLVPVLLIALFGHIFGLYKNTESGPSGIRLAVVNLSSEPAAADLVNALKSEKAFRVVTTIDNADRSKRPLTEADVRAGLRDNKYRFALIIPVDLIPDDQFGIRLKFLSDPRNEIESQTVNGILQKTIFSHVPQLLGQSLQHHSKKYLGDARFEAFNRTMANTLVAAFGGDAEQTYQRMISGDFGFGALTKIGNDKPASTPGTASGSAAVADAKDTSGPAEIFSHIARIETEQVAGKKVTNPMATRLVGGYAIMFLLFALAGSATSLFEEKRSGIYQRILSAPVRLSHILWGQFLFGVVLGTMQLVFVFLAGKVLFKIDLFSHVGPLFALIVAAAAACTAFGMLVAAVSNGPEMASGLSTFLVLTMSAVGGAWVPVSFMPEYVQMFSRFTLVYWSIEGFASVLWAGQSFIEILPTFGILAGIAAGVMALAVVCFKRSSMFD